VLSISGYHMVVVSGIVFVLLRALFALCPPGRGPIKKWAALAGPRAAVGRGGARISDATTPRAA
jgi:predicted membrane metal-binding protein